MRGAKCRVSMWNSMWNSMWKLYVELYVPSAWWACGRERPTTGPSKKRGLMHADYSRFPRLSCQFPDKIAHFGKNHTFTRAATGIVVFFCSWQQKSAKQAHFPLLCTGFSLALACPHLFGTIWQIAEIWFTHKLQPRCTGESVRRTLSGGLQSQTGNFVDWSFPNHSHSKNFQSQTEELALFLINRWSPVSLSQEFAIWGQFLVSWCTSFWKSRPKHSVWGQLLSIKAKLSSSSQLRPSCQAVELSQLRPVLVNRWRTLHKSLGIRTKTSISVQRGKPWQWFSSCLVIVANLTFFLSSWLCFTLIGCSQTIVAQE